MRALGNSYSSSVDQNDLLILFRIPLTVIAKTCQRKPQEMLYNVRTRFDANLYYCVGVNGKHFEHFTKLKVSTYFIRF